MAETRLSFKDMCAKFDVTPRTLRYYEYIELIEPDREGRARFYGPREIARMTLILRGRKYGYQRPEAAPPSRRATRPKRACRPSPEGIDGRGVPHGLTAVPAEVPRGRVFLTRTPVVKAL